MNAARTQAASCDSVHDLLHFEQFSSSRLSGPTATTTHMMVKPVNAAVRRIATLKGWRLHHSLDLLNMREMYAAVLTIRTGIGWVVPCTPRWGGLDGV